MPDVIISFKGDYRFLSNFYPARVLLNDHIRKYFKSNSYGFNHVEGAYQAAKAANEEDILKIQTMTAGAAKKAGRSIEVRDDWEDVKVLIMRNLLIQKFSDPELRSRLLKTEDAILVEGNSWCDNFWGVCYCDACNGVGQNMLGQLLMKIRYMYDH